MLNHRRNPCLPRLIWRACHSGPGMVLVMVDMTLVEVRNGIIGDESLLVAMEKEAFGAAAWPNASIANSFMEPFTHVLIAQISSELPSSRALGFLVWRQIADEAEVLSIGVRPSVRQQGVGLKLMAALGDAGCAKRLARALLDVDINNGAALALYHACGYHRIGLRPRYYRNGADAVIMAKTLM